MEYLHVKNIEKFHPGYKDRKLRWMKLYFDMIQGDPEFEMIDSEIDKWRFISLVVLELQAQKPIPLDDKYLTRKGFDLQERPMPLTLKMLHNFLIVNTQEKETCGLEEELEEEKELEEEEEEERETHAQIPSPQEVSLFFTETAKIICPEIPDLQIRQSAAKYFRVRENERWLTRKGRLMADWKLDAKDWLLREKQYYKSTGKQSGNQYQTAAERKKEKSDEAKRKFLSGESNQAIISEFEEITEIKQIGEINND